MKKGLLIVVSGPAGSGKGTVAARLIKTGTVVYSVSATTRAPRPGEQDGVNYHFIDRDNFIERINSGDMIEHTEYCGNFYGTPKKETEAMLESGKNVILELEVEGAKNIKAQYPEAILILFHHLRFRSKDLEDAQPKPRKRYAQDLSAPRRSLNL